MRAGVRAQWTDEVRGVIRRVKGLDVGRAQRSACISARGPWGVPEHARDAAPQPSKHLDRRLLLPLSPANPHVIALFAQVRLGHVSLKRGRRLHSLPAAVRGMLRMRLHIPSPPLWQAPSRSPSRLSHLMHTPLPPPPPFSCRMSETKQKPTVEEEEEEIPGASPTGL
jgi:hypothetical protein